MIAMRSPLENALIWGLVGGAIGALVGLISGIIRWRRHKRYQQGGGAPGAAASAGAAPGGSMRAARPARDVAVGREVLISLAGMLVCLGLMVVALVVGGLTRAAPPRVLGLLIIVAFIAGAVWVVGCALFFVLRRGRDKCPKCGKVKQYYGADRGMLLECRRCGHQWTAGGSPTFFR